MHAKKPKQYIIQVISVNFMKVAIYQTSPKLLDVQHNLDDIISKIRDGANNGVELCVFPELALTGYFVGQHYHDIALKMDSKKISQLVGATKGTAAVVGFIEETRSMNFYNSALVAINGEIELCYRKINLPNYHVFEEKKYFSKGTEIPTFWIDGFKIAPFICNDLWHPSLVSLAITQETDVLVTIFNSSEGSMSDEFKNIDSWDLINKFYPRVFGVYNICANRVGTESLTEKKVANGFPDIDTDNIKMTDFIFWGKSQIINPYGNEIVCAKKDIEDVITAELDLDILRKKRIEIPYLRQDDPYFMHRKLTQILKDKESPNYV